MSVPILGSRAREQLPGTSITLRAPGFRGALSRPAGALDPANDDQLPFTAAAAGADVLLASRLELQIEALPRDEAGLRTRSAAATQPQLIVPRRPGIAYALLQTDADGRSDFVLPLPGDVREAVFPFDVPSSGAAHRSLRLLMWPGNEVLGDGALEVTARWERLRRPNYLAAMGAGGARSEPDWDTLGAGPMLLVLHGTFGTPESAFGAWFADPSFGRVIECYESRCLAFAHPTLATSVAGNLAWLLAHLPKRTTPIDIVGHGRGGLLARAIVADGRIPVRRVCQVGAPNNGAPLAREPLAWLNGHVAKLATLPAIHALPTLEGALALVRSVALGVEPGLPGIETVTPDAQLSFPLAAPGAAAIRWFTVGANYRDIAPGDDSPGTNAPNDLVVSSEDCHHPGPGVEDSLRLTGENVHHHNYFTDRRVRERLSGWLCD